MKTLDTITKHHYVTGLLLGLAQVGLGGAVGAADPGCTVRMACEGGPTGFEAVCSTTGAYSL